MQSGFNNQRAKLKELFVQKERELEDLKTKMIVAEVKAQEEISSLQQLVQGLTKVDFWIIKKIFTLIIDITLFLFRLRNNWGVSHLQNWIRELERGDEPIISRKSTTPTAAAV